VGEQYTEAAQKLQKDGLNTKPTYVSSTKAQGTVLSQKPVAPQLVKRNSTIRLTVSGTQTSTTVPSVLGDSPAEAGSTLQGANLTVGSQSSMCSGYQAGTVAAQSPAPGNTVAPSTPVNLSISTGSCVTTTVPPPTTTTPTTTSPPTTAPTTTPTTTPPTTAPTTPTPPGT